MKNNEENVSVLDDPCDATLEIPEITDELTDLAESTEEEHEEEENGSGPRCSDSLKALRKSADSYPVLSLEQEIELGRKMCAGDRDARKTLINCNMRYALQIANIWWKNTYRTATSTSFDDMAQNALCGLIRAVDKYDPEKGNKVISFAKHDIGDVIRTGLDNETHIVRIPEWRAAHIGTLRRAGWKLEQILGRYPNAQELYEYFEHRFPLQTIKDTLETAYIREHMSIDWGTHSHISSSGSHDDEETDGILKTLETQGLAELEAEKTDKEIAEEAWKIINTDPDITQQEKIVAQQIFIERKTMAAAGAYLEANGFPKIDGTPISRQRVSQLEQRLIAKLREKLEISVHHKDAAEKRRSKLRIKRR